MAVRVLPSACYRQRVEHFVFEEQFEAGVVWPELADRQAVLAEWELVGHPEVRSAGDYLGPADSPPRWGRYR